MNGSGRRRGPDLLDRLVYFMLGVAAVAVVLDAGWLETGHNRVGGIAVLLLAAVFGFLGVRPRR